MINEKKVAVMTRMAAYEAGEGRKDETVCSYFRSDYVGLQLVKTWLATTAAYAILAGIRLLYRMDSLTDSLYAADGNALMELGSGFLLGYVVLCVVYLSAAWIISHITYRRAYRARARLEQLLQEIDGSEDEEDEEES